MATISAVFLALIVNFAPLALGSNRALPWTVNAILAGTLLLLTVLIRVARGRQGPQVLAAPISWPLALFVIALLWIGIQMLPLGQSVIGHPIWSETSQLLGHGNSTISVSLPSTIEASMRLLTALTIGMCAYIIGRDGRHALFLLQAFAICAALYASYGLYRLSTNSSQILWFDQPNPGFLTSTFISRNNAATYFGIAALTCFGLLLRQWRHAVGNEETGARERVRRVVASVGSSLGVYLVVFFTLFVALLLTESRAGISSTLIALGTLMLLQVMRTQQTSSHGGVATVSAALVGLLTIMAILQLSGAKFVERLTMLDVANDGRLEAWTDTIAAIRDHLWVGSGYGTFQAIFPLYRSATRDPFSWDKAHNDYLELILDLGLPVAMVVFAAFGAIAIRCLKAVFERRRNAIFSMVATAVMVLVALHAIFDFSLQIQAVTLVFAMLIGVGLAQSYSESA